MAFCMAALSTFPIDDSQTELEQQVHKLLDAGWSMEKVLERAREEETRLGRRSQPRRTAST
jgi:cell division protein FtsB